MWKAGTSGGFTHESNGDQNVLHRQTERRCHRGSETHQDAVQKEVTRPEQRGDEGEATQRGEEG